MRYLPLIEGVPELLHGADYNPDQWLDRPEVIDQDFELVREARMNSFSIGIFAWAALEPEEGRYEFGWLDALMDRMHACGMKAVLATPSGAKPNWMAVTYPEIRRVSPEGRRDLQSSRHNHCYTSPVYREKVTQMVTKLAERYGAHPALGLWHLSNEYSGQCHCDLCKAAFRDWLKQRYGSLEALNKAWWTTFWSHTYTDWDQINAIDAGVQGLVVDWKRFVSFQTADFMRGEMAPLKRLTPRIPVTTNLMGTYAGLDYRQLAPYLDVVSWDAYPKYHAQPQMAEVAMKCSFAHDLMRGLKGGQPFLLMESSPSSVNWMEVNKLLRPGIHRLKSLQAVAHGAESVQYFQWRKSRGSCEQYHGAVLDHVGHPDTRVFRDVAQVGRDLQKLSGVVGCPVPAEAAILYDWDILWALEAAAGPLKLPDVPLYERCACAHYAAFWRQGIPVDIRGSEDDLSGYKLIVAPMLYLIKAGVAEKLRAFVEGGGTLVGTFLTGIADAASLAFGGGWPGPLRPVFGIWAEEIDYLYEQDSNRLVPEFGRGLKDAYAIQQVCDLIHAETAEVHAVYGEDFYAGRPCLTRNACGRGSAWYIAAHTEDAFLTDFYAARAAELGLRRALDADLPAGVTAQVRTDGSVRYLFVMNFAGDNRTVVLNESTFRDVLSGESVYSPLELKPYDVRVLIEENGA